VLVHLHGGPFVAGAKNRESLPLLSRPAGRGWVCISANHPRGRGVRFPDHVVDVKRVLAWVREHGEEYGAVVPVEWAREFATNLAAVSEQPFVYSGLPGAQHSFDYFRSLRARVVVDRIEAFAAWVRSTERRVTAG
jgi:acetyl esterase/lipase